ncbi:MAG: spondin domain-containing protein [Myxococcota bacterium]
MRSIRLGLLGGLVLGLLATPAFADSGARYRVTVTNITKGQTFTPILVTTHSPRIGLFEPGTPASPELEVLAEDGGTGPLTELLEGLGSRLVADVETIPGLLAPGESRSVEIRARRRSRLSAAAMLIPTNDTFFGLDTVRLPLYGSATYYAPAYDAGTEENDQNCANMPGPRCDGDGLSAEPAEGDEGFVAIGNGFHDIGTVDAEGNEILGPFVYDWRNPVVRIDVQRLY